jgi:uncharacterized protein
MPQTALITGASSGIGRALATQFVDNGYDVVLIARNEDALASVARTLSGLRQGSGQARRSSAQAAPPPGEPGKAGPNVQVLTADLAQAGAGSALVDQITTRGISIDVVVNNAGFGLQGEFAHLPLKRQIEMIQLNVTTLTELTRLLLPPMLSRGSGGVLNVASTAAFQPGPLMAVYYATKAYVLSFTEAVAEEVAGTGLKVSCLCPGPTETEFAARAAMTGTNLFKGSVMSVEAVAREAFAGWNTGKVVIVPGASNRRGALGVRLLPRAWVRRVVKRLNSLAGT